MCASVQTECVYKVLSGNKDKQEVDLRLLDTADAQLLLSELVRMSAHWDVSDECARAARHDLLLWLLRQDVSCHVLSAVFSRLRADMPDLAQLTALVFQVVADMRSPEMAPTPTKIALARQQVSTMEGGLCCQAVDIKGDQYGGYGSVVSHHINCLY